jgi:hypothetical protein
MHSEHLSGTHSEVFYGRRTRLILVVLLLLTVAAAASALFVRYRLELLKALVQREVQTRAGLAFQFRNVEVNGLYGFRILDVSASLKTPLGPFLQINVPKLEADIDLAELIYGNLSVQRIRADHSDIEIMRQPGGQWLTPKPESAVEHVSSLALPPFRVVGRECRLIARNVVGETTLTLQRLAFDIGRPPDSTEISARMSGDMGSPEFPKETVLNLRFVSAEDFDLRVEAKNVSAENVNVFLPASRHIVQSGIITPTVRVAGYPGQMLTLSLEAPYEDLEFREQPEFIDPFTGKLTALGQYDMRRHLFSLATAKTRAQAFEGNVDGSVDFSQSHPVLDLRMRAEKTPLASLLGAFLPDALSEYGALNVEMAAPAQLMVTLTGSTEEPVVGAKALMDDVKFTFTDNASREAVFDIRKGEATWDSGARAPTARFEVVRGSVSLAHFNVEMRC